MPRRRDDYDSYDDYSDSPPRHRDRRSKPAYKEEEIIEARGAAPVAAARRDQLIRRQMSDDSIEEVRRDFPPGGDPGYARRTTRRARSDGRGKYDGDYSDDEYYGSRRKRDKRYDDRKGGRRRRDYSSSGSESPAPRRHKSLGEQALAALGVGGLAGAAASGGHNRDRSRDRDRGGRDRSRGGRRRRYSSSSSRSRSRSKSVDQQAKIQQAVKAAFLAGATEAFRSRKEPGGWAGAKGKRVLTAAIGAGGIDGLVNGDKDPEKKGTRHTIEAVIGGLAGNRLINGGRDKSRDRGGSGRHSDKESGGGGLEKLLGAGAAAAAGKAFLDRARSKSRDRGRKDYSSDSDDSRGPPRGSKKRSKSVTDYARQGMAALGIGADQKKDTHGSRHGYGGDDDYYSRGSREPRLRGGGGEGGNGVRNSSSSSSSRSFSSSGSDADSDMSESSEDERKSKKMRGKEFLTAGLASVATIHAAHSVYQSVHARNVRHKEVLEGKISSAEARKKKNKARLQDAASIGIAALGIKGAIGEWKEMKEQREEHHKFEQERQERHEKRLRKLEDRLNSNQQHQLDRTDTSRPANAGYSHSDPGLAQGRYPPAVSQTGPYWNGPHYADGNPYATEGLPPPPIGPYQQPN
ncbi:MAG: hypothetical protein Q9195_006266 [Heterodermia aff. obscurata]